MSRIRVGAALAATLVGAAGVALAAPRAAAPQRESVIVTLRAQADLRGAPTARGARLRFVVDRLQSAAAREQRPILALLDAWRRAGSVSRVTSYWIFDGLAVTAAPDVVEALRRSPAVAGVTPDAPLAAPASAATAAPEWNVDRIGAPTLWSRGDTGRGVVVASLDSGVDAAHPDLASRWRGGSNSWYDPYGQHAAPVDLSGHGTQVMGVIVGGGAGGSAIGVAPDARWIAARIYDDRGRGTTSAVHLAFQWLLDPDHDPATADAPQVVNGSWTYGSGCNLEFAQDIQALRAAGILPVFAAGNDGGVDDSPANNPGALAVGATDGADALAPFSSRGPSACGEPSTLFPELTAPGVGIRTSDLYGGYTVQDGTSLAAPHVAGALALLLSAYPGLTPEQQEAALEGGAVDLGAPGPDDSYGYGRLDVVRAYDALATPDFSLSVDPPSASTTAGGTAVYTVAAAGRNGFSGDVALTASGLPPGAAASFSPAAIAGGTGSAGLTVGAPASLAPGTYPFSVTGTSGSSTHAVPASLVVAPPPDFAVAAAPSSASTTSGGSAVFTVGVSALDGFADDVSLSLSGLTGQQATWSFQPATVAGGSGSSQLTVVTAASLAAGTYPLTITGTSGGASHSASVTLAVAQPADFALTVSPASVSVARSHQAAVTVGVTASGGFSSKVTLSASGLPSGASASFSPNPVAPGAASKLTLKAGAKTARGTYTVTVTGTGAGRTHSRTLTVTIT